MLSKQRFMCHGPTEGVAAAAAVSVTRACTVTGLVIK
jgi:hypothetical protein